YFMSEARNSAREWVRRKAAWSNSRQSWEERVGLAIVLSGTAALLLFHARMPAVLDAPAWGALCLATVFLLRRCWLKLFGPILFSLCVCIARGAPLFVWPLFYALLLTAVLGWVYLMWTMESRDGSLPVREMTYFAETFFYTFMFIQLIVVVVLTPAYAAGAVA